MEIFFGEKKKEIFPWLNRAGGEPQPPGPNLRAARSESPDPPPPGVFTIQPHCHSGKAEKGPKGPFSALPMPILAVSSAWGQFCLFSGLRILLSYFGVPIIIPRLKKKSSGIFFDLF